MDHSKCRPGQCCFCGLKITPDRPCLTAGCIVKACAEIGRQWAVVEALMMSGVPRAKAEQLAAGSHPLN